MTERSEARRREAWTEAKRMDRCCRLYILFVSRRLGLIASLGLPTTFCKHSRYSEVLLAGAHGFYLSLLEKFSTLKSCVSML
jgi:hypothetical protein